jgi:hypothetical protein
VCLGVGWGLLFNVVFIRLVSIDILIPSSVDESLSLSSMVSSPVHMLAKLSNAQVLLGVLAGRHRDKGVRAICKGEYLRNPRVIVRNMCRLRRLCFAGLLTWIRSALPLTKCKLHHCSLESLPVCFPGATQCYPTTLERAESKVSLLS